MKSVSAITPNTQDPQHPSPSSYKSIQPVVCNCKYPTNHHDYNCSVMTLAPQRITTSRTPGDSRPNANNRTPTPRMSYQTQSCSNDAHSIHSAQAVNSVPFPNNDYVLTSASQQSPFSVNNSTCPAKKTSPTLPDNQHQSQAFIFPPTSSMKYDITKRKENAIISFLVL